MHRNLNTYLNKKNFPVYQSLINAGGNITLDDSRKDNFWSIGIDRYNTANSTIFLGKRKNDVNAFTHELLHHVLVLIGQNQQVENLYTLVDTLNSTFPTNRIRTVFDFSLVILIDTSIQHGRMLPVYLNDRFKRDRFVYDYYKKPKRFSYKTEIQSIVVGNIIDSDLMRKYLRLYFIGKYNPHPSIKKVMLNRIISPLKNYFPDLVDILDDHCLRWDTNPILLNNDFLTSLTLSIETWRVANNFI
jgi:hypothetical protein